MQLTDLSTLLLFSIAAIGLTISIVIYWQHLYRRTFRNLLLRLFLIMLCQALALMSIGLQVNRANSFFESWNDLFGTTSSYSSASVSSLANMKITKSELNKSEKLPFQARMVRNVIIGENSKVTNVVYLYLPHSAAAEISKGHGLGKNRYRVVEFLTGFPSQPEMWVNVLAIDQVLALYNESHVGHEIIGVIPQVNIAGRYDLECMNLPGNKAAAETWLSEDMHTYVAAKLGIPQARWGIMGVSTGGWCSAMLSIRHPDLYSAAVSIAGYYRPALPLSYPKKLQDAMTVKYDLDKAESNLSSVQKIYLTASLGDKYSIRETRKFLAKEHPHLKITFHELPSGGHNSRVWVSLIPGAFDWLQRNISV